MQLAYARQMLDIAVRRAVRSFDSFLMVEQSQRAFTHIAQRLREKMLLTLFDSTRPTIRKLFSTT